MQDSVTVNGIINWLDNKLTLSIESDSGTPLTKRQIKDAISDYLQLVELTEEEAAI